MPDAAGQIRPRPGDNPLTSSIEALQAFGWFVCLLDDYTSLASLTEIMF
jgi:hypothetical protein